jgi:formate-dependent phosphoribosylglycinamide formyltransferase (GAR transformylase)
MGFVNVLMISPGFPAEMPHFTRGLARMGARVFGLGDQPERALPPEARESLVAHLHVASLWDEPQVIDRVRREARKVGIDRVECLWEPAMILAARLREALGVPGLNEAETVPFRDKESMKQVLDAAGIRTPWHKRASSVEECRAYAEEVGFPLIIKPIAGAGSRDTHRVDGWEDLERILPGLQHVEEVSVEEYVDGDEFTFDTICADGRILFENISFYRPRPIEEKKHQWISPSSVCLRDIEAEELQGGRHMGRAVLTALGYRSGFTHMEWYRKSDGEVVFGEIGARPPGAHLVDAMNYACDVDLFSGWAEAVCHGRFSQPIHRRYNAAVVCKRALGRGTIQRVEGLQKLLADLGPAVAEVHIEPLGSPAGDWRQAAVSAGYMVVRHPDLQRTLDIAARVARELQIYAE